MYHVKKKYTKGNLVFYSMQRTEIYKQIHKNYSFPSFMVHEIIWLISKLNTKKSSNYKDGIQLRIPCE